MGKARRNQNLKAEIWNLQKFFGLRKQYHKWGLEAARKRFLETWEKVYRAKMKKYEIRVR